MSFFSDYPDFEVCFEGYLNDIMDDEYIRLSILWREHET